MLSCKEVVRILGSGEPLGLKRKLMLNLHLSMCKHCGTYARQLKAMKNGFIKLFQQKTSTSQQDIHDLEAQVLRTLNQTTKDTPSE